MAYIEPLKSSKGPRFRAVKERGGAKGPSLPTEVEARRWAVSQGWIAPPVTKLNALVQEYVNARLSDEHPISAEFGRSMIARLESIFRRRGWTVVSDMTLANIDAWRVAVKGQGVRRTLAYLLAVLRWGVYHRDILVDPKVLEIKHKRQKRKITAQALLSGANIRSVIKASADFGIHAHAILHYLSTYGPRPITACRLRCGNVKLASAELVVDAKHSGEWRHPLRKDTVELFAACIGDRGPKEPLFLAPAVPPHQSESKPGRPMVTEADGGWKITSHGEAAALANWYYRVIGKAHLPKGLERIYHLKRYAITSMLDRGMNPKQIAEFTGHLTVSQVLEYARTSKEKAEASVAMLPTGGRRKMAAQ